jgi:hypothetical protein
MPSRRVSMLTCFSSARAVDGRLRTLGAVFSMIRGFFEKSTGSMLDLILIGSARGGSGTRVKRSSSC